MSEASPPVGAPPRASSLITLMAVMASQVRPALVGLVALTVLTGAAFPAALYGLAGLAFPDQAAGSLVKLKGAVVGSRLIGQAFARPDYFHPRPSAAGAGYDASASSGTNLGPNNPKLAQAIRDQAAADTVEAVEVVAVDSFLLKRAKS